MGINKEVSVMRKIYMIFIFLVAGTSTLFSQEFMKSDALQLFNDGMYKAAIDSMKTWIEMHPSEKGLVHYFLGESYYHQCFEGQNTEESLNRLQLAIEQFRLAEGETDIQTRFSDKLFPIRYKLGWCYFRLAEYGVQKEENLIRSIRQFENSIGSTEISMKHESRFMAGFIELKLSQLYKIQLNQTENTGFNENLTQQSLNHLHNAGNHFRQLLIPETVNPAMKNAVLFLMQEMIFTKAMLFCSMPSDVFNKIQDTQKASTAINTSIELLNSIDFNLLKTQLAGNPRYLQIIPYFEAKWQLSRYVLTGDIAFQQLFNEVVQNWQAGLLNAEKQLMQGIRDFHLPGDRDQFVRLIRGNNYFTSSAQSIPEAKYWQGWAAFLGNPSLAITLYNEFLESVANMQDPRMVYLMEDAKYRRFMIEFESNIDNRAALSSLANEINQFKPEAPYIQIKTARLSQMVQIGLGEAIWNEVLQSRTLNERLDEALSLIQTLMLRATQVFGRERQLYINYLNQLFSITAPRRKQETTFYRGLTLFLQAEIQENARSKRRYYQMSIDTLSRSRSIYQYEAQYVQARSYFAASKHFETDEDRNRFLEEAKPLFIELVNNKHSLRSLFYLGEIYRIQGNHLAAVVCYDEVMDKTYRQDEGTFWYENAQAARQNCLSQGDADAVNHIQVASVVFPEKLLEIDGQVISLEKFADREYIMRDYKQQATQIWLQFGHPWLSAYPSVNPVQQSVYYQYSISNLNVGIQERLGKITAGVRIKFPEVMTSVSDIVVKANNEILTQNEEGFYEKSQLPIYQPVLIQVNAHGYFPLVKEIELVQPGIQNLVILPSKRMTVVQAAIPQMPDVSIQFNNRLDGAVIGFRQPINIRDNTLLYKEFDSNLDLRDIAYSQYHNRFIVTHTNGELHIFNNDPMLTPDEEIALTDNEEIDDINPEGITIDNQGNLYISDWSHHRIIMFSEEGIYLKTIGKPLHRDANQTGEQIRLLYPNHLMIVQPELQATHAGDRMVSSQMIVISDQMGIHFMDENGYYWETLVQNQPGISEWMLINASGYGENIVVNAWNRADKLFARFTME